MKLLIILSIFFIGFSVNAQTKHKYPKEVVITFESGALFTESNEQDFKKATITIPKGTKLVVENMNNLTTAGGEKDEVVFYFYRVKYNGKIGWIKASCTNYPQM